MNNKVKVPSLLEELGEKHRPSKRLHNYLPTYATYLESKRTTIESFLEIGLETGASVQMWEEYFPNAKIYGIDINPTNKDFETERIKVFIGDQGDNAFLQTLPPMFDVVVDDGSHRPDDIISTFKYLFPRLSHGGYYIIEDLELDLAMNRDALHFLKNLINNVNYWPKGLRPQEWPSLNEFNEAASWWDKNVLSISFYRYLTIIQRGKNPQQGEAAIRQNEL